MIRTCITTSDIENSVTIWKQNAVSRQLHWIDWKHTRTYFFFKYRTISVKLAIHESFSLQKLIQSMSTQQLLIWWRVSRYDKKWNAKTTCCSIRNCAYCISVLQIQDTCQNRFSKLIMFCEKWLNRFLRRIGIINFCK